MVRASTRTTHSDHLSGAQIARMRRSVGAKWILYASFYDVDDWEISWRKKYHRRNGEQIEDGVEDDCHKTEVNAPSYLSMCSTTEKRAISDFCRVTNLSAARGFESNVGQIVEFGRQWR